MPAIPGVQTEPGLLVYHFGADLFYANENCFTDEVRSLIAHAPSPVRWLVIDAGAITAIDYSAARAVHDLCDDLGSAGVDIVFARVSTYLLADMDRHRISDVIGTARIFTTMHEAVDLALANLVSAAAPGAMVVRPPNCGRASARYGRRSRR